MPELPEVELMRRALSRGVGRRIVSVEVADPKLAVAEGLAALRLEAVSRRGKTLLLRCDGLSATIHPRMSGRLLWRAVGGSPRARLRLGFEGVDEQLVFDDPRRLGVLQVGPAAALALGLDRLGPEPWPTPLSGEALAERFLGDRRPVKVALLDQARLAGVGNIGATEACWRAGIDPRRPADTLAPNAWSALSLAVVAWIEAAIAEVGEGELELLHAGGSSPFLAYGRAQQPCLRCGDGLVAERLGGRGTVRCARCQV
jgi:formamidopyrimidine-DNA glycosylase